MANARLSVKERNLLKGAIRRVFSRSDLRRQAIDAVRVEHTDPERPRVKKWGKCPICLKLVPLYLMEVDHTHPIIPIDSSLEAMTWDDVVNRIWCDAKDLQGLCKDCHKAKTKLENKQRRLAKKALR